MIVNYSTQDDGRIATVTTYPIDESKPTVDFPDDIDISRVSDYLVVLGDLVKNPLPVPDMETVKHIAELKAQLAETDYVIIKIAEGAATTEEYSYVIKQRSEWRAEINRLEDSNA